MIIYSVGQEIYSKEETSFECATKQFLCRTVCYDQFMPINFTRFWIWNTHFLALIVLLFHWIGSRTSEKPQDSERVGRKRHQMMILLNLLQSAILLGIEILFGILLLFLLARQHSPSLEFKKLLLSGEIFFSPSVYACDIQKTFSEEERLMYFKRENVQFRKSPPGLRVKAQMACDQSDALCTIDRSSEKTAIVLCIILFSILGIISLLSELLKTIIQICTFTLKKCRT